MNRPRLPRFWVYLLLAREDGKVYAGYTGNLRQRFKRHNSPQNKGWTAGQRWHLLAVKCFIDRDSAILFERQIKASRFDKSNWIKRERDRVRKLCRRHGIPHRLA